MTSYLKQNVRSVYETCQYSRFALSNGKMLWWYTEYAYIKLRSLRWAVTPNDKSFVYVNVILNGRL